MKWNEWKKNKIHILNPSPLSQASRSDTTWHAPETSTHRNAHARSSLHIRKTSTPLIFLQMAEKDGEGPSQSVHMQATLGHYHMPITEHSGFKCVFKKPGIIMMWQRFLISCSCYRRTLTRSYLKLPSFSVIGESQSTVEDNNLPSITILPTLVWLHTLSLSCINQELNPRGCGINQQRLAWSLHFSDNEDSFIIISHSA